MIYCSYYYSIIKLLNYHIYTYTHAIQNILEKRRNDFKTEGEYISKILNRNLHEEFMNQMKKELKGFIHNLIELPDTIEQIPIQQIPGCEGLNEKLDLEGVSICISLKTEKLISMIFKCQLEMLKTKNEKEKEKFKYFCFELIVFYFKKRIEKYSVDTTCISNVSKLPQYAALMLNDMTFSIIYMKVHDKNSDVASTLSDSSSNNVNVFHNNSNVSHNNVSIISLCNIRSDYYNQCLKEQEEEISFLLQDIPNVKSIKKVSLFLSRLEKVLNDLMIKSDWINLKFYLLNFIRELSWNFLVNLKEIPQEEIDELSKFCAEISALSTMDAFPKTPVEFKIKAALKLFNQNLIEIINCYHREEYSELKIKELRIQESEYRNHFFTMNFLTFHFQLFTFIFSL